MYKWVEGRAVMQIIELGFPRRHTGVQNNSTKALHEVDILILQTFILAKVVHIATMLSLISVLDDNDQAAGCGDHHRYRLVRHEKSGMSSFASSSTWSSSSCSSREMRYVFILFIHPHLHRV